MIPYVNAHLTEIRAPGTVADYDVDPVAGTARWTGRVGIYADDTKGQILSPGRIDEVETTRLEIPWNIGRLVQQGDTLVFTYLDEQQTAVAADLKGDPLVGRRRVMLEAR